MYCISSSGLTSKKAGASSGEIGESGGWVGFVSAFGVVVSTGVVSDGVVSDGVVSASVVVGSSVVVGICSGTVVVISWFVPFARRTKKSICSPSAAGGAFHEIDIESVVKSVTLRSTGFAPA